jgi:hypothetical protein
MVLGCAGFLSLSWLYPGSGAVQPEPVAGTSWLNLPDGSRVADAYVYDRIGTGASSRRADPADYTTARAVEDLEAVRGGSCPARTYRFRRSTEPRFPTAIEERGKDCRAPTGRRQHEFAPIHVVDDHCREKAAQTIDWLTGTRSDTPRP